VQQAARVGVLQLERRAASDLGREGGRRRRGGGGREEEKEEEGGREEEKEEERGREEDKEEEVEFFPPRFEIDLARTN
jgi:hypothetical protein